MTKRAIITITDPEGFRLHGRKWPAGRYWVHQDSGEVYAEGPCSVATEADFHVGPIEHLVEDVGPQRRVLSPEASEILSMVRQANR